MAPFYPGNETLFRADLFSQLLLRQPCPKTLIFQLFTNNESITRHLELFTLRSADGPEILRNEVLNGGQFGFIEVFHSAIKVN